MTRTTAFHEPPDVLDRHEGPYGEVVLRRHGELLQIIANGCFLTDTSDGRSERLLNETCATFDALCLDVDNGPGWTVTEDDEGLYSQAGLASCARALRPDGVLAVWSAQPSREFEGTLRNAGFRAVHTEEIQVARGVPDVVHLAVRPG